MDKLKSGFKINLPFCLTPDHPFNGQLSICVDRVLASLKALECSYSGVLSADITNNVKADLNIKDLFCETADRFFFHFLPGKAIEIKMSLASHYGQHLTKDTLQLLFVFTLRSILSRVIAMNDIILWSVENLPLKNPSVAYALMQGGAFWYTLPGVCQRIYLPPGLHAAIIKDHLNLGFRGQVKESSIPAFLLALNRSEIDILYEIGEAFSVAPSFTNVLFALPDAEMTDMVCLLLANNNDIIDQLSAAGFDAERIIFAPLTNVGIYKC